MEDFDIEDWWTGGSFVESGIPVDFNIPDITNFDVLNYFGGNDLAEAFNFGDLSGIASLGNVDFSGLANYDQGDFYDFGYGDLGGITGVIEGFGDAADMVGGSLSGGVDQGETFGDLSNLGISTDAEAQEGGFYGNTPSAYYDPRTNLTTLYDESGKLRDFVTHEGGIADIGGGAADVESQPGGFYGNTPNATYDPKSNTTTIRDNDGNVVRTIYHSDTVTGGGGAGGGGKGGAGDVTKGLKDNALLLALLGGLLGLLGRRSQPKLPVGYQGGIPKYTAARVPGRGVQYTRAAGGGLMDLAGGGQPARYLRGGTDGMADKIETSIDGKQPARLSHGEFVIPADVVSHLGNGNSDAGADVLYDMMAKVRKARTGTTKQGKQINPRKMIPA